jgi:hypothetical protein
MMQTFSIMFDTTTILKMILLIMSILVTLNTGGVIYNDITNS